MAVAGAALGADVVNPHVTTDRSIDTSSVKAMVAGLVKPGMSDREKALAIYNYVRRTMFHYRHLTGVGGGGAMNLINGTGYTLCTPTASVQVELCEAAGLKARILNTPGHGSCTVFYDGRWHWMDAFLGGCVWNKDKTDLAGLQEVVDDPSLLTREDPSPVPLFPCRDLLYADALRFEPGNQKYHQACAPDDASWTQRAKPGERHGAYWSSSMTLDITLRPGETYLRRWDHEPGMYFLTKVQERFAPPHHFCGLDAEKRDRVNWPYWKPYVKPITSLDPKTGKTTTVQTGRYWANGRLTWRPDLSSPDLVKQFALARNVQATEHGLAPADPARAAVLEWTVTCPYILQGGWLRVKTSGTVTASIKTAPAGAFAPLPLADRDGALEGHLRPHFLRTMGTRNYVLHLELAGRDARLSNLELDTVLQHNMYALPQLMPGRNRMKVVAADSTPGRPRMRSSSPKKNARRWASSG